MTMPRIHWSTLIVAIVIVFVALFVYHKMIR